MSASNKGGSLLAPRKSIGLQSETPAWSRCIYCENVSFGKQSDFIKHLHAVHCTTKSEAYFCLYGYEGICSSLPLEGVNSKEYDEHILLHHVHPPNFQHSLILAANGRRRKMSRPSSTTSSDAGFSSDAQWTVYSGSQNLPAVLNDPNAGKQRDFFTKQWGDSFVERADIPKSLLLPEITAAHFDHYMKKISRRYRKHVRMKASSTNTHSELLHTFPILRMVKSLDRSNLFDLHDVPTIFTEPSIDLSNPQTFNAVFTSQSFQLSNNLVARRESRDKLPLDQLTNYLDLVEEQIAKQVAHKSESFFYAMTSHDALMEHLGQTITVVKALRENIQHIDKTLLRDSLDILRLERIRRNHLLVHLKLKLMVTVHQTQPMIQLLLSTPDYVAALDLISTTQEILAQELAGIHSFRHLGSQLTEMERMIDKMLTTEFERYSAADLNRPLLDNQHVLEADKLVSIIMGMLRQKHFHFIDTYKDEAFTTVKAIVKQIVIEVIAASDCGESELALTGLGDQLQNIALHDWIQLLETTTETLLRLIKRVKAAHDVMLQAANFSSGKDVAPGFHLDLANTTDSFLSSEEHGRVLAKLSDLMTSVCDYAHERVAQLVTTQTQNNQVQSHNRSEYSNWLVDKATAAQVCALTTVMDAFTVGCEEVCGRSSTALRSALKVQASKFVQRFHNDRKTKLSLLLDSERWKQADVPAEFQNLLNHLVETGKFALLRPEPKKPDSKAANVLVVVNENYAVVGTVLLLFKIVVEYCVCASDLPLMAPNVCRNLGELLQLFNSRCCQLVLGAGALQVAGLKTITSTNLVLASRALQLVLWLLPSIREHFKVLLSDQPQPFRHNVGVGMLDTVCCDIDSHVKEIQGKVVNIINNLVVAQLGNWEAKPPVPSQAFRNISKHFTKLHEAVASALPVAQVHDLYRTANTTFKEKLREHLIRLNVVNNGGPQHGVVTSELTFYLQTMKTLKAMPLEELGDNSMDDIWSPR